MSETIGNLTGPRSFQIPVVRIGISYKTVEVTANTQAEAEEKALTMVGDDWWEQVQQEQEDKVMLKSTWDCTNPTIIERLQARVRADNVMHGELIHLRMKLQQIQSHICMEHTDMERTLARGVCMVCAAKALNKRLQEARKKRSTHNDSKA